MKKNYFILFVLIFINKLFGQSDQNTIILDGNNLTIENLVNISNNHVKIKINVHAQERVRKSHKLLLQAGKEGKAIYGLNRGVGLNKDRKIFNGNTLDPQARKASENFNKNIIYSHSAAIDPELSNKIVFPLMLVRLNMMLQGKTGVSCDVVNLLAAFINHRIQPVVPSRGSVGEGDITILSHIGLALMGEGEVIFNNTRMPSSQALKLCNLNPIIPYAKDALSILSSNAYSAAMGALLIFNIETWLNKAELIFALSLEALNGNLAPFLNHVQVIRPFIGQKRSAENIIGNLNKSYLWDFSPDRELQDPLSFRSISQVHGTIRDILNSLKQKIILQINSSDDNPAVILDINKEKLSEQEQLYYLKEENGAVIPNANFEPINWVIEFESLAIALTHASHLSVLRMIKLDDEKFTKLTRFLAPNTQTIGFGTIQKSFLTLDTEIRALSSAISSDFFPLAGEIEDHASNAPLVMHRLCKILSNLYYIFSIELMHSSQAIDLRKEKNNNLKLGESTKVLYQKYREKVKFLEKDRPLFSDIRTSYDFLIAY